MIQNIKNGKVYIGKTEYPKDRWQRHLRDAFGNDKRYQQYIHRAIKKHGVDSFTFNAFQSFENEGYNLTNGGEGKSGAVLSQETKDKIGKAHLGKQITTETRHKLSVANKGKRHREETKAKIRGNSAISKLTEIQVVEIREKYQTSQYTFSELANEYGVGRNCIMNIVKNKTWKHLPMFPYTYKKQIVKLTQKWLVLFMQSILITKVIKQSLKKNWRKNTIRQKSN